MRKDIIRLWNVMRIELSYNCTVNIQYEHESLDKVLRRYAPVIEPGPNTANQTALHSYTQIVIR